MTTERRLFYVSRRLDLLTKRDITLMKEGASSEVLDGLAYQISLVFELWFTLASAR